MTETNESLEAAARAMEIADKTSPFYVHATREPDLWSLREKRSPEDVVVKVGTLTAMIIALMDANRENKARAAIEAFLSAEKSRGFQMMPDAVIAEMYAALCGARHAIDVLMGDTDPNEDTPAVLAMQGVQLAIEAVEALYEAERTKVDSEPRNSIEQSVNPDRAAGGGET